MRRYCLAQVAARMRALEEALARQNGQADLAAWRKANEEELYLARAAHGALRVTTHPPQAVEAAYWLEANPELGADGWRILRAFPAHPAETVTELTAPYEEAQAVATWLAHELLAAATLPGDGDVTERLGAAVSWLNEAGEPPWLVWHVTWPTGQDGVAVDGPVTVLPA